MILELPLTGLAALAGPSALVAAAATVLGAVLLGLFFARGGAWGPLNDLASIVMMLATIPVVAFFATWTEPYLAPLVAVFVAAVGVSGMIGAATAQGLLLARVRTYEQLLPWTLGAGAVVGFWYVLIGITGAMAGMPGPFATLAVVAGVGYGALGYGFWRGNERHPLSVVGGIALLISSTIFLTWLGVSLVTYAGSGQ
ncbi:MAG TPA: hypothetical protein VFI15_11920 [Candidatus Limnocylindrales bacterium]|nr:hypothetical protein [Candidatus Limnocylindrales bacterium]